jgi:hypothetical protein
LCDPYISMQRTPGPETGKHVHCSLETSMIY